jgi:HK97 family phage major capsid protein
MPEPITSEQLEGLVAEIGASDERMKGILATQAEDIKRYGATTEETAAALKEQEALFTQIREDVAGYAKQFEDAGKLRDELKTTRERLDEMEKAGQRPTGPGAGKGGELIDIGARFVKHLEETGSLERMQSGITKDSARLMLEGKSFHDAEAKSNLTTTTVGAGVLEAFRIPGIVGPQERMLTIRDLMRVTPTSQNAVEYVAETGFSAANAAGTPPEAGHGAAAAVTEGDTKPEAEINFDLTTATVRTIAHWLPVSRQILDDFPALQSYVNSRLTYGVRRAEEQQVLYGTGTAPQVQGILVHASRQTLSWSAGTSGDSQLDFFRRAITLAQVADYPVDGAVLNPSDWEDIELLKGTDDRYVWVTVPDGGVPRLWRVPVVVTNAITSGEGLLGAFSLGGEIFDREQASVRFSEHHASFFVQNLIAILGEERLAVAWYRPEAFVDLNFDSAPA